MDISVIIVNYNTCELTCKCLDSIFANTQGVKFEVIVVDNDSQLDDSKQVLSKYPGIRYVQASANLGFGKANNLGYTYATGRYVLFLNSDTYLLNDALTAFVQEFDKLSVEVGCIGAQLLSAQGEINNSYSQLPSLSWYAKAIGGLYISPFVKKKEKKCEKKSVSEPFEVPYVIGADLCVRREVIEQCGMFDPEFFMYYEDSELQYRYHAHGYKSYIVPSPRIVHLECASLPTETPKQYTALSRKWNLQSQALYFKKTLPKYKYVLYRIISLLSAPLYLRRYYTAVEKQMLMHTLLFPMIDRKLNKGIDK